jgi:hypothetical protein
MRLAEKWPPGFRATSRIFKKPMRAVCVGLVLAAASPAAVATDLINRDGMTYQIAVTSSASTMKTSIAGRTVKQGICAPAAVKCVVKVDGVGEIEVTGADDVVIKDGKLSKQ